MTATHLGVNYHFVTYRLEKSGKRISLICRMYIDHITSRILLLGKAANYQMLGSAFFQYL